MTNQKITRRTFMERAATGTTLIGAGTLLTPSVTSFATENKEEKGGLKFALKYWMIQENIPILDKFKLIKDLGYSGIELHADAKLDKKEVSKAIEITGIPIHSLHRTSKIKLKDAIDIAKYYDASSILIVAGKVDAQNRMMLSTNSNKHESEKSFPMQKNKISNSLLKMSGTTSYSVRSKWLAFSTKWKAPS